jgi:CubicO group peptidase (beta-lactamase class C family)
MQRSLTALAAAFVAMLVCAAPALAQDTTGLPQAPVPYAQIRAKPAKPKSVATPRPTSLVAPLPPVAEALDPVRLEAFIDGWMTEGMAREHVAGAAVTIVQNGQVVLKKGYGYADVARRRPVDPDRTLFRIGSISKTFTWILLMRDVEAGRIHLDRPINLYLPEKLRVRDQGRSRDIMVANLINHTAGFEDRALGQLFERDPRRIRPLDLYLRQERPRRVHSAGALASYSNYGAALVGQAGAFMAGKTFERRVEDEITVPLGMARTTFREPREPLRGLPAPMPTALWPDVAQGYGWRNAGFERNAYEFIGQIAPAGSASSSAADMGRYMRMLLADGSLDGATIFGPTTARAFRTPMLAAPEGINGWAHGFMVLDLPGGHRGYGHLGHTIAFQSNMTLVPALGLGVFVTTNSEAGARLADVLPSVILAKFEAAPSKPRNASAELAESAAAFEGDYLTTRRPQGGLEDFTALVGGGVRVEVTQDGRLLTHRSGEAKAWFPDGPISDGLFLAAEGHERLAFKMSAGRAVSFRPAHNGETLERANFWRRPGALSVLASLTLFAALATLAGSALRNRRELRQNQVQAQAALVQNTQAVLWLAAIGGFALWTRSAGDPQALMYDWPGPWMITASTCALVASTLTLITIASLPAVWQGGRRVDSWSVRRKLAFTGTVLIYVAQGLVLAFSGALEPWNG